MWCPDWKTSPPLNTDSSKAAIQQWDGSWLLKRKREREVEKGRPTAKARERERARNGGVVGERKKARNRVKGSTRQNINLYVNRTKARGSWGGFSADAARGVIIKPQEVVFFLNCGSVQKRKWNPWNQWTPVCQARWWAGRRSLTPSFSFLGRKEKR